MSPNKVGDYSLEAIYLPVFDLDISIPNLSLLMIMEDTCRNINFLAKKQHESMLHHFHHSS